MALLGSILRDVSRSFYISIRILPGKLREPVGLAYLLARATDTVADTSQVPPSMRASFLQTLASAIQGPEPSPAIIDLVKSFRPLQTNESERRLIESLPQCFELLGRLDAADRADVREVLAKINRGQMLDVERPILDTTAELDEYTYLVAGCVGEFWTRVCFRHVDNFSDRSIPEMSALGKRYGMGLQLINILRDAGTDLRNGRCYFPTDELKAVGSSVSQIESDPGPFMLVFRRWLDQAQRRLESGMEYVSAIESRRVRAATALPALIGARTLALLRSKDTTVMRETIKVPRNQVRGIIGTVTLTLANRNRLRKMFHRFLS